MSTIEEADYHSPMATELGEAHEIAGLLFGVTEVTRTRFDELCERFEVTPVQARALLALARPVPMRDLAAELQCDPSNVTGIADRLEQRGLLRREPDPADRRVKLLVATPRGERVRRRLEAALRQTSPFLSTLTDEERRALHRLLSKVAAGQ